MSDFKKLSRAEMKNVLGGSVTGGYCIGSTGSWNYVNSGVSPSQCSADIQKYCSSGHGGCTIAAT